MLGTSTIITSCVTRITGMQYGTDGIISEKIASLGKLKLENMMRTGSFIPVLHYNPCHITSFVSWAIRTGA